MSFENETRVRVTAGSISSSAKSRTIRSHNCLEVNLFGSVSFFFWFQLTWVFHDDEAQINKKLPKELLLRYRNTYNTCISCSSFFFSFFVVLLCLNDSPRFLFSFIFIAVVVVVVIIIIIIVVIIIIIILLLLSLLYFLLDGAVSFFSKE